MQMTGIVSVTPNATKLGNNSVNPITLGKNGDVLASPIHGPYGAAAVGGGVYHANTAAAGVTVPISSATAAVFGIINPAGSGFNVELIDFALGHTNATLVVAAVYLGLDFNLSVNPTGITRITPYGGLLGNGSPQAIAFSAATVTATTRFYTLGSITATSGLGADVKHDFKGSLWLPPGSLAHLCSTAAQTQASAPRISWAEWAV